MLDGPVPGDSRRGQTVLLFVCAILISFGMLALVADVGWSYFRKEAAQSAADAAALAAASAAFQSAGGSEIECGSNRVVCQVETACPYPVSGRASNNLDIACLYAQTNGFQSTGRQRVTVMANVTRPPTAGGVAPAYWVTVRVREDSPQLFARVLQKDVLSVAARSTSGVFTGSGGGCVFVTNPGASGAVSNNGAGSLASGCGVYVNSSSNSAVRLAGDATITTGNSARTSIVGGWLGNGTASISPAPITEAPVADDPFTAMNPPDVGACTNSGINLGSYHALTISPAGGYGVICGGIWLASHAALTLQPGLYVVKGGISLGAQAALTGSGVTIYLVSGGINIQPGAAVTLSAPTSGSWQGIVIYQDRADTSTASMTGGPAQLVSGVIYMPNAPLIFQGGSSRTNTTLVVNTLELRGNSSINAAATTAYTRAASGVWAIE